ncbi:hypothetical protein BGZ60DRAFT_535829 [Tricladium varicosporioides]|nr:hypothetical protein BGZ60DRAFT_535829 [Hymenoscyphus varicosporioides]
MLRLTCDDFNIHIKVIFLRSEDSEREELKSTIQASPGKRCAERNRNCDTRLIEHRNEKKRPLSWAIGNRQEATVRPQVNRNDVKADAKDERSQTPLAQATINEHEAVVRLVKRVTAAFTRAQVDNPPSPPTA